MTKTTYVVDHDTVERTVDRIYRRQLPKMEGSFYSSVKMTIASAEFQQLLSAVNDFGNAPDHMIQRVSFDLRPLAVCIRETAVMSSDEFLKLSSSIHKGFTPDEHQFMMDLIKRGTTIAQELNNKTRNAIRAALKKALMSELTPPEVASLLTNTIGLDDRFATAVESFRQGLIARGVPKAQARKQSAQYASSLRHTRANTIARTETAKAIQAGQKHSYDQIVSNLGIPDAFVRIEWITAYDERTCPNCAPMNGVQVGKDESFATPIGQSSGPPLHPNCRCTTTMRFTDPALGVSKGDYPGHPFRGNQWTGSLSVRRSNSNAMTGEVTSIEHDVSGPVKDHFVRKLGAEPVVRLTVSKSKGVNHQMYVGLAGKKGPLGISFGSKDVSRISWHPETGRISAIHTQSEFMRKGFATDLFDAATALSRQYGLTPPVHSETLTADGAAWAEAEQRREGR